MKKQLYSLVLLAGMMLTVDCSARMDGGSAIGTEKEGTWKEEKAILKRK